MITPTEELLGRVCRRSFLRLWSHPHAHRPPARELCDVLVVFGDDVIVFSDKSIAFRVDQNVQVAWGRWYRRAIGASSKQLFGALRWLREHPDQVFEDVSCTKALPVPLPDPQRAKYHLVAVAWGANEACGKFYGRKGPSSFAIKSDLVGDAHFTDPFCIGRVDATRPFVHIFDEVGLHLVMKEVDTAPDFVEYLSKREALLTNPACAVFAPAEQELLANYLWKTDESGSHQFLRPNEGTGATILKFDDGDWERFAVHPQRMAKIKANEISYRWDTYLDYLIDTLWEAKPPAGESRDVEAVLRLMASESRLFRRMRVSQAARFFQEMPILPIGKVRYTVAWTKQRPETAYLFLSMAHDPARSREQYENSQRLALELHLQVLRMVMPEARQIVGIATDAPRSATTTETLCLVMNEPLTDELRERLRRIQEKTGILADFRESATIEPVSEYPGGCENR